MEIQHSNDALKMTVADEIHDILNKYNCFLELKDTKQGQKLVVRIKE